VSNHSYWSKEDGIARFPNAPAQIHLLEMIEKLLVESA
jgi:hypothetical protein